MVNLLLIVACVRNQKTFMSSKYKPGDNQLPHFITFSTVDWIDVFTRDIYREILIDSIKYCQKNKGLCLNAWVIMTNHLHLIMSGRKQKLISDILRDFKKFTSKQILQAIENNPKESRKNWLLYMFGRAGKRNSNNEDFQFWQQDYHPIELNNPEILRQKLDYLHENPVRAGFVYEPQQYVYSSAVDYYTDRQGLIEIEYLW